MLPSLILNGLLALGKFMMYIVYGEEGWKAAKTLKKNLDFTAFLLTVCIVTWIISVIMLIASIIEGGIATIFVSGVLIVLTTVFCVSWISIAKKESVPAWIEEAKPIWDKENEIGAAEVKRKLEADEAAKAAGWTCTCGRVNAAYVSGCVCGMSKQEAKIKQAQQEKVLTDE